MKKISIYILIILGISIICYFMFHQKEKSLEETGIIVSGCFNSDISKTNVDLNQYKSEDLTIKVNNSCTNKYKYYLVISVKNKSSDDSLVKIKVNDDTKKLTDYNKNTRFNVSPGYLNSYILDEGEIKSNDSITYKINVSSNKKIKWESEFKVVGAIS